MEEEKEYKCCLPGTGGVSSPADVSGAYGIGKVKLKFRPVKRRSPILIAATLSVYCFMLFMIFVSWSWNRPMAKRSITLPVIRTALAYVDYFKLLTQRRSDAASLRPGQIEYDAREGLVHISADTLDDAIYHQGYAHASDRLLQMDIYRRMAMGKLSELFGNKTRNNDHIALTLNFLSLAADDYQHLSQMDKESLIAYSDGVNAYIAQTTSFSLPLVYTTTIASLHDYLVEPWTPVHTLALLRLQAYEWSSSWERELFSFQSDNIVSSSNSNSNSKNERNKSGDREEKTGSPASPPGVYLPSAGGTLIAIAGKHSQSGSAIIASDFLISADSVQHWYSCSIHTPNAHTEGVSVPGIPFIYMGRNRNMTWAFTPSIAIDTEDLFLLDNNTASCLTCETREREEVFESMSRFGGTQNRDIQYLSAKDTSYGPVISSLIAGTEERS